MQLAPPDAAARGGYFGPIVAAAARAAKVVDAKEADAAAVAAGGVAASAGAGKKRKQREVLQKAPAPGIDGGDGGSGGGGGGMGGGGDSATVGQCRLSLSKSVLKAPPVSALEASMRRIAFKLCFQIQLPSLHHGGDGGRGGPRAASATHVPARRGDAPAVPQTVVGACTRPLFSSK